MSGINDPVTAREALLIEAIGEVGQLLRQLDALSPTIASGCGDLNRATTTLQRTLGNFKNQIDAFTERARAETVKHVVGRTDEAARRSIALQRQAMAEAARAAFGDEMQLTVQHWQRALQPLLDRHHRRREAWLTHAAALAAGAAAAWVSAVLMGCG